MIDPYVFTCIHEQKEIIAMHTCHMCVTCVCRTCYKTYKYIYIYSLNTILEYIIYSNEYEYAYSKNSIYTAFI